MIKGLLQLTCEERLRERGLFRLEKTWGIITIYKYLMGGSKAEGISVFSLVPNGRTRSNEHKPKHRKFHSNIRKNLHCENGQTAAQVAHRELVESASLEILRTQLDMALSNLL